ncbi:DUF2950 family protein [Rhizobium phaseoli]|uniref:DUF2950 family protein n=1 Tax=Rhizobium phaseoli TaxID=396 RepID=UPI003D7C1C9E
MVGKQSHLVNGHTTAGFALIAWPVKYCMTGVQTFVVKGMNLIYQRDLESRPRRKLRRSDFNPDRSNWTVVEE